eukprot:Selendium_serpulae@DN5592_c0_g1_i1.p2
MSETQEAAVPGAEAKGKGNEAKEARKAARQAQAGASKAVLDTQVDSAEGESNFGYLPLNRSQQKRAVREWTDVGALTADKKNEAVWLRGRVYLSRLKGNLGFITLRQGQHTVQCVLDAAQDASQDMLKWAGSVPVESIVDVLGKVIVPEAPIKSCTQPVEISVQRIFCVSKSLPELPFQLKDANLPEDDADAIKVNQDVRLDNRVIDLRTFVNQAVVRVATGVCELFREYLRSQRFLEIHTPKLLGGSSEGGSNVFHFKYFDRSGCLSQSPQLYKQMAICADLERVFETGPVFRAENSNTHRHLCEFTGLNNIRKVSMFPRDPKRLTP